jgi:hypothetical protein
VCGLGMGAVYLCSLCLCRFQLGMKLGVVYQPICCDLDSSVARCLFVLTLAQFENTTLPQVSNISSIFPLSYLFVPPLQALTNPSTQE